MSRINWDAVGQREYETGIDHGVLYLQDTTGAYPKAEAWNGLTAVNETPSGAEANPVYADNMKYLTLYSAEDLGVTIECITYPELFEQCDGTAEVVKGVAVHQQSRKPFGLCYRTLVGNDVNAQDHGYKLHLLYGAMASPSERAYNTVNESPETITFSYTVSTTPASIKTKIDGKELKPTALLTIDSTKAAPDKLKALEDVLYGTDGDSATEARLPLPDEVFEILGYVAG